MAGPSEQQLMAALRKADAAGDTAAAKVIAKRIQSSRQSTSKPLIMPDGSSAVDAGKRLQGARAAEIANDPTRGNSFLQNATIGLGKSMVDTVRGVQQIAGFRSPEQVEEDRQIDAPLMRTGGGVLGNVGGQIAQMSVPVGRLGNAGSRLGAMRPYVGAAVRGGAFTATQPMGVGQDRAWEAGKGALLAAGGQKVANVAGATARGAVTRMEPAARKLAQKADQMGFRIGLPQLSQNPMVRTVASQLDRLPFSGASKRNNANQATFNEQVGGTFGAKGDKITPDVFARAKSALSNKFEELTARNSLGLGPELTQKLAQLKDEVARLGLGDSGRAVSGWIDELASKADDAGIIPGRAYQAFDSKIGQVAKAGGDAGFYLGRLRDVVREGMDNSISAADRSAWQAVRQQWAAMKTVEPLVAKSSTGDISAAQLMGRVTSDGAGKVRMASGNGGKLGDLARIGQQYLKDAPNSGTADRLLVNMGIGGGLFGAQQTGLIDPQTAAIGAGLLIGNRVAGSAINSRALAFGENRALNGLARLVQPAPRALPAGYQAAGGAPGVSGIDPQTGRPYGR